MTEAPAVTQPREQLTERWWAPIVEFAIHVAVGTLIFAVIASAALLLDLWVQSLSTHSIVIRIGLRVGEYALFVVDLVLFLIFLLRTAWRTMGKLWKA